MKQKRMFNKCITLVIAALVMMTFLTACKENKESVFANKQYGDSGMKTIISSKFDYSNGLVLDKLGFGFTLPQIMKDLHDSGNFSYVGSMYSVYFMYFSEKILEANNVSEEEQMEALRNGIFQCFTISRIPANDEDAEIEFERINSLFQHVEPITTVEEDTYYFAYNDDYCKISPTDVDKSNIERLLSVRESLKNSICLFPAEIETLSSDVNMNSFSTKTLSGEVFTQDNFAEYDLTMVNVWTTWCGPCVDEMPDLQKLYVMLPHNVNMITICADANEESELAMKIINELGCTFQTLYPNEQLEGSLLKEITGYPTTVFFDRNGNIVGDQNVGVPGKNPAEKYLKMIEERLVDLSVETGAVSK